PGDRVSVRLQVAIPEPLTASLLARRPFTVTDEIPLPPRPASVAMPVIVIVVDQIVWLGVVSVSSGRAVSVPPPPPESGVVCRKFATIYRVLFKVRALSAP